MKKEPLKESPEQAPPLPLQPGISRGDRPKHGLLMRIWKAPLFSSTGLVVRALMIAALYGVSKLFGLREYTTFISGTSPNTAITPQAAATLGLLHLLLYVAFILAAPILMIAAGLLTAWQEAHRRSRTKPRRGDEY
jgi:hypothetical protein